MTLVRMILPEWRVVETQGLRRVVEGQFTDKQIKEFNAQGYNIYFLPNSPSAYDSSSTVDGTHIDNWRYVFVDCDLKDGVYASKDDFITALAEFPLVPTQVIDSGNGVHAYWQVSDLDPMSYLRLQRRLSVHLKTDEAVGQLFQLMRLPNTTNTKHKDNQVLCEEIFFSEAIYACEELNKALPPITQEDEEYCQQHYAKTYSTEDPTQYITDEIPPKFGKLLRESPEAKEIWTSISDDRSKNDFRLGHLMFAKAFTKEEAVAVLVNTAKALARAPKHRLSYATNIVEKIWTYEEATPEGKKALSSSIADILAKGTDTLKGVRFPCNPLIDNTEYGFRLGQVLGLVAGSGVGKTAFCMNIFLWFCQSNPDYHNFIVPLEQPPKEIADRWQTMTGNDTSLHSKVHVLSNYDDDGTFRNLSLEEIKEYIMQWQKETGNKVGCVVIDHIGALKKKGANDEFQDLISICHSMKSFAVETNTFLIMQSQTSREKAGIGDLALEKDAAFGTTTFEWYVDFLVTMHQPVKRCYAEPACPTVSAFKFCKIRHKNSHKDVIKEDVCYYLFFDTSTGRLRAMTQDEITAFNYFLPKATNLRKVDRKTGLVDYQSVPSGGAPNESSHKH